MTEIGDSNWRKGSVEDFLRDTFGEEDVTAPPLEIEFENAPGNVTIHVYSCMTCGCWVPEYNLERHAAFHGGVVADGVTRDWLGS